MVPRYIANGSQDHNLGQYPSTGSIQARKIFARDYPWFDYIQQSSIVGIAKGGLNMCSRTTDEDWHQEAVSTGIFIPPSLKIARDSALSRYSFPCPMSTKPYRRSDPRFYADGGTINKTLSDTITRRCKTVLVQPGPRVACGQQLNG